MRRRRLSRVLACVVLVIVARRAVVPAAVAAASAGEPTAKAVSDALPPPDGRELYGEACAACHGADGRGSTATGVTVPLPDFTDCRVTTAEPDSNWLPLVAHGGPALGMSSQMPSFDGALTADQQRAVLAYVRSFCTDPAWPQGDLNFPQPLFVGKAFPEDEIVVHASFGDSSSARELAGDLAFERRVGARGQVEIALPAQLVDEKHGGPTAGGFGDLTLAYKHVAYAGLAPPAIASLAVDLVLPSGDAAKGTGEGTVAFEPALLAGARAGPLILQTDFRAALPIDASSAPRVFFYRFALQAPLGAMRRSLVPALELETAQRIDGDFHDYTALGPTFYVPLSKRGHVALALGGQVPVSAHRPFDYRVSALVLWDYLDGPLW